MEEQKFGWVHSHAIEPVKKPGGGWDVRIREFDEYVPDKGRACLFCNACNEEHYPECIKICPAGRQAIEKAQRAE